MFTNMFGFSSQFCVSIVLVSCIYAVRLQLQISLGSCTKAPDIQQQELQAWISKARVRKMSSKLGCRPGKLLNFCHLVCIVPDLTIFRLLRLQLGHSAFNRFSRFNMQLWHSAPQLSGFRLQLRNICCAGFVGVSFACSSRQSFWPLCGVPATCALPPLLLLLALLHFRWP